MQVGSLDALLQVAEVLNVVGLGTVEEHVVVVHVFVCCKTLKEDIEDLMILHLVNLSCHVKACVALFVSFRHIEVVVLEELLRYQCVFSPVGVLDGMV